MRRPSSLCVLGLILCSLHPATAGERTLRPILPGGHSRPLLDVALSHDGKRLLTAAQDNTVILWDTATGERLHTLTGHMGNLTAATLSGDGKIAATASGLIGTVVVWDALTGQKLRTLDPKASPVRQLALSGDGRLLLMPNATTGKALLLETATGKELAGFQEGFAAASSVALSTDGKVVAATLTPPGAILWDAATNQKVKLLPKQHTKAETCVAVSADGKLLVTGSLDMTALLWSAAAAEPLQRFKGHSARVHSVAISADGKQICTGAEDRTAIVWDVDSGRPRHTLQGHTAAVTGVALSADGKLLATGSLDMTVRLWDPTTGKQLRVLQQEPITKMALSADGSRLVALAPTTALLWDLSQGKLAHALQGPLKEVRIPVKPKPLIEKQPSTLTSLAMAGTEAWVVIGSDAGEMRIWEAATGKQLHTLKCGKEPNLSVALSADHKWLVTAAGPAVAAKELQAPGNRGFLSHQLTGASSMRVPFTSVAVAADGKTIAAGMEWGSVQVWPPPAVGFATTSGAGRSIVGALAMSADGAWILAGTSSAGVILSDQAAKKTQRFIGPLSAVNAVALAADNKRVAAAFGDRTAVLWDAATGERRQTFVGHSQAVNGVAIAPDGKRLWTSSADGTVRLWDTADGKELCRLVSFDSGKEWLVVTPDGACDGSAGGLQRLAWRDPATGQRFDDEATRQRLQRPGLLATLLKGERPRE